VSSPNLDPTLLDQNQILQRAFDEDNDRLRVDATVTATLGETKITDGSKDATITTSAGKNGLDVNVINDLVLDIDQATDSIKIGDGTNLVTTSAGSGSKRGLDVNVINTSAGLREQILGADDVQETLTWANFNSSNERVTQIVYVSASVGHTATKVFNYSPVNGAYQLNSVTWSVT